MDMKNLFQYLIIGIVFLMVTACGGGGSTPLTAEQQALNKIANYVNNGTEAPEASDYQTLHITGVTEENVDAVNQLIDDLDITAVTDIQGAVNALEVFRVYAESHGANGYPPSQADYEALGITGVTDANRAAINDLIAGKVPAQVDSQGEIQGIIEAMVSPTMVTNVEAYIPNDTVTVTISGVLSGDEDWAGIYPVGASNAWGNVVAWNWVHTGDNILNKDMKSMPKGEYEVRLFFHNSTDTVEAKDTFSVIEDVYSYGEMGDLGVGVSPYSQDNRTVVYHPTTWNVTPTPVIFFAPGWHNTTHTSYETLLRFIASHGYSVIYMPDVGGYDTQATKFDAVVNEFSDKFDTSKIGILGHSAGGGAVFYLLEHMIANGYGESGRFMMSLDGYFAYYMDQENMQNLSNTNILFMQFGPSGNSTDPRVVLTNYWLLTGTGIDKNYIVLPNDDDHGYPARQDIETMQGMLQPLDALMEYTFTIQSDAHHAVALEGEGKIDPYSHGYQQVLPIDTYDYDCHYANSYHKGPDGATASNIDNCGIPEIAPNNNAKKLILHQKGHWLPSMAGNFASRADYINTLPFSGFTMVGNSYTDRLMKSNTTLLSYAYIWDEVKNVKDLYPNKSNFLIVHMHYPGDFWDDGIWSNVIANFRTLAKVAKDLGFKGITYDDEAYDVESHKMINYKHGNAWYDDDAYKNPNYTFPEHVAKITARFKQIMEAMIMEYPAIDILYYHSPVEGHIEANDGIDGHPVVVNVGLERQHEMTAAMFMGLQQGLSAQASLHDMGEDYRLRTQKHFDDAYTWRKYTVAIDTTNDAVDATQHWIVPETDRATWAEKVQVDFMVSNQPLASATYPEFDTTDKVSLNDIKTTLERAIDKSDKYVTFYSASSSDNKGGLIQLDWLNDPTTHADDGSDYGLDPTWKAMVQDVYEHKIL